MGELWVTVVNCLRRSAVNLKRDLTGQFTLWVFDSHTEFSIDSRPNAMVNGKNLILVPSTRLHRRCPIFIAVEYTATVFVIEFPPPPRSNVSLITQRLPVIINWL